MRQVENILAPLRDALAVDGAVLQVAGLEGSSLRLTLSTDAAQCAECIVADEVIESMVLARLAAAQDPEATVIDGVRIEHVTGTPEGDLPR